LSLSGYAYITFTTAGSGENSHDYDIGLTDNNGGQFRGTFNVEMTHSGQYKINTKERNAWFTQIVGRDFDYSLLLYDENMTEEQNLDRIVVKISLINEDTNLSMYDKYGYFLNTTRADNLIPNDLDKLPATKRARFRIFYGLEDNGSLMRVDCNDTPKVCFEALPKIDYTDARDNFAIRPAYFHITISDNGVARVMNTPPLKVSPFRASAGYDYHLTVISILPIKG